MLEVIAILAQEKTADKKDYEENFREIFAAYYPNVCRHLTYLTGSQSTAEDIAQETFLKLYQSPPQELRNPAGWLIKVSTNLAYNYIKSEKSRQDREMLKLEESMSKIISLEDLAIKSAEVRTVRKILKELKPRDSVCLLLRFSGYNYREIAEVIGIQPSSVGTILARAQRSFREKYLQGMGREEK